MYQVHRNWLKYGHETDFVETTFKEFDTEEKAIAYADRYATGIRFVSVQVYDESNKLIYEIVEYGSTTYDYRN